jgi:hypothetical protein
MMMFIGSEFAHLPFQPPEVVGILTSQMEELRISGRRRPNAYSFLTIP